MKKAYLSLKHKTSGGAREPDRDVTQRVPDKMAATKFSCEKIACLHTINNKVLKNSQKGLEKVKEIVEFYNVAKIEIEGEFLKRSDWKLK